VVEESGVKDACAGASRLRAEVSEKDEGRAVELSVGEEMCVRLPSNRGKRYTWAFNDTRAGMLELVGEPGYAEANDASGRVVEGWGTETWRLRARTAGVTVLRFEYQHASDEPIPPERVLSIPVTVSLR
jgi:predicted secreted protein